VQIHNFDGGADHEDVAGDDGDLRPADRPALAMSGSDMSCADFTAMDSSGRMAAVHEMETGMMSGDKMTAGGNSGAMASDKMTSGNMSSDKMASDKMGSDHTGVTAESVAKACADQPDMMVMDAIEKAKMAK
jgi:hypothetical protein